MADSSALGSRCDLTGLVQVVFSEDRLKNLLEHIYCTLEKHSGRISEIEVKTGRSEVLQSEISQLSQSITNLSSTFENRSITIQREVNRLFEQICQKNRTFLNQTEVKIEEGRCSLKGSSDLLKREMSQALENVKKDRANLASALNDMVKKQVQTITDELGQVRSKYVALEEQWNHSTSPLLALSMESARTVEVQYGRNSQSNNRKSTINMLVQKENQSRSEESVQEVHAPSNANKENHGPSSQFRSKKRKTQKNKSMMVDSMPSKVAKQSLGTMKDRMDQLERKQNRLQMIFNKNPREYISKPANDSGLNCNILSNQLQQLQTETKRIQEEFIEKSLLLQQQNKTIFNQLETMRVKFEHEYREISRSLPRHHNSQLESHKNTSAELKLFMQEVKVQLEKKVDIYKLEGQLNRLNGRLEAIQFQLAEKSEKEDVKRALVFIEGKLKDVITLVAQTQKDEKDALFTKTMMKCLSCDKELDRVPTAVGGEFTTWKTMPTSKQTTRFGLSTAVIARRHKKDLSKEASREEKPTAINFDE